MKNNQKGLIGIAVLALLGVLAWFAWPFVEDHFRDARYRGYLEAASQRTPKENDLFEREDSDDWLKTSGQFGFSKLSDYAAMTEPEVYRLTILRMGRSGMITVILGKQPRWEAVIDAKRERMSGNLSRSQVSRLRAMVKRCHFWEINEYPESGGCDGEDWFFEGISDGRYRRIHEWCPDRTYVDALGNAIASITVPELAEHTR